MALKYFHSVGSLKEATELRNELIKENHPDVMGDKGNETSQEINAEFAKIKNYFSTNDELLAAPAANKLKKKIFDLGKNISIESKVAAIETGTGFFVSLVNMAADALTDRVSKKK